MNIPYFELKKTTPLKDLQCVGYLIEISIP